MKFCTQCGNSLPDGVKFCPFCGNRIVTPTVPEESVQHPAFAQPSATAGNPEKKSGFRRKTLVILLVVGALIIGLSAAVIIGIHNGWFGGDDNSYMDDDNDGKKDPTGESDASTEGNKPADGTEPSGTPGDIGGISFEAVPYDGSDVTITFYHTIGSSQWGVLDNYITEFNKLYPNIHIIHELVGNYDDVRDQIKSEIKTDNQPNIAYCYPDHVALYNQLDAVITLDSLINSTIEINRADGTTEILGLTGAQKADFIEGFYNEGRQFGDGLMYTMPMSKSTEVLYYNKTFFDANNLSVPTTWDEMEALCAKILTIDSNCIPLGYDSEANWFINLCEQYGSAYTCSTGDHFLFDNDTNRAFAKRLRDWFQNGYVITQNIYIGYTSGLFTESAENINSYMCIASSAGATHQLPIKTSDGYPFEVGIAAIPQVDPSNPKVVSQGPSLCIFKDANPQEVVASWLFVKFLTTNVDFQTEFSMASNYIPVLKSAVHNEKYAAYLALADGGDHITALSAQVCMSQAGAYFTSPGFDGSAIARDEVGSLLVKCLTMFGNDVDAQIDTAFQEAIDECERRS